MSKVKTGHISGKCSVTKGLTTQSSQIYSMNSTHQNGMIILTFSSLLLNLSAKPGLAQKIKKIHDKPKTPFQRLIESKHLDTQTTEQLKRYLRTLNPFDLHQQIKLKIKPIFKIVSRE